MLGASCSLSGRPAAGSANRFFISRMEWPLVCRDVWFDGCTDIPLNDTASSIDGFLAKYDFSSITERGAAGMTPLHYAAYENNATIIRKLVAAGADLEARDDENFPFGSGCTPFFFAAALGRCEAVDALLELRADVLNATTQAPSVTHIVVEPHEGIRGPKSDRVLSSILASGVDVDHQTIERHRSGAVIRRGSGVSLDGTSMLFLAAHGNDLTKIQLLLDYRANPLLRCEAPPHNGRSALDVARELGSQKIVDMLEAAVTRASIPA